MFSLFPSEKTVCVSVHAARLCVCVRGLTLVCVCTPLSATTYAVIHFEPLLSDSYRLDVCVVAEASKQHCALCIPLKMGDCIEYSRRTACTWLQETHPCVCVCVCVRVLFKHVRCDFVFLNPAPPSQLNGLFLLLDDSPNNKNTGAAHTQPLTQYLCTL